MARRGNRQVLTIIGLILTLGSVFAPLGKWGKAYTGLGLLFGGEVLWWASVVMVVLYVALVERRPFSSIGFRRPKWSDILAGVGAAVVALGGILVIYTVLFPALHLQMNKGAMNGLLQTRLWFRILLVTRAAVGEELLFRGYAISRLE